MNRQQIASHAMFALSVLINGVGVGLGVVDGEWSHVGLRSCALAFVLALWVGLGFFRRLVAAQTEYYRAQIKLLDSMIAGDIAVSRDVTDPATRH